MGKKRELLRGWQEETVGWHKGSMEIVQGKPRRKKVFYKRCAVLSLLLHQIISQVADYHTSSHQKDLIRIYPSLQNPSFPPGIPQSHRDSTAFLQSCLWDPGLRRGHGMGQVQDFLAAQHMLRRWIRGVISMLSTEPDAGQIPELFQMFLILEESTFLKSLQVYEVLT